jgi:transketolase
MPNLRVLRPADAEETSEAWAMAMERQSGPTVLALTRQNTTVFPKEDPEWRNTIRTGAYIVRKAEGAELVIIATGSDVGMALEAAQQAAAGRYGKKIQVVSMISRELFESQDEVIRNAIVPPGTRVVCCEAGSRSGWERWAKPEDILSIDRFGESGPAEKVVEHMGFTVAALVKLIG